MTTILYARVSTSDQTIGHQKTQAVAAGFTIDKVISDDGVSGVSTRLEDRSGGKRLFDLLRSGDTLVVRWLDRLGRNYQDVCDTMREFLRRGVTIRTVINNFTFDGTTTDPMQSAVRDALIGFMAAMGQAQAEATKEAQKAGIEHAKQHDKDHADDPTKWKFKGRKPTYSKEQLDAVLSNVDTGVSELAKLTKLSRQTIYRIKADPVGAVTALAAW